MSAAVAGKKITLEIGDLGCKSRESAHSTKDFDSQDSALAYMWAMAHASTKEVVWMPQGLDGWMSNVHMRKISIPEKFIKEASEFIAKSDAAYAAADCEEFDLDISIRPVSSDVFEIGSRAMDCCFVTRQYSEIDKLIADYKEIIEADNEEGFKFRVKPAFSFLGGSV